MRSNRIVCIFSMALFLIAASAQATESGSWSNRSETKAVPWTFPGVNISSPVGFGSNWGSVYAGASFLNRTRGSQTSDGALGAGFGVGDSANYVGLDTSVGIMSVTSRGSEKAFGRGAVSFKVHRQLPWQMAVAVGRENAFGWGTLADTDKSWYGAVTKVFVVGDPTDWLSAITLNAGVGNGRFQSEADVAANKSNVNVFGSAAVRVLEPISVILDWGGQDLNVGLSITPIRDLGLFINPALVDVTKKAGDGARFLLSVGFGYDFTT